MFVMPAISVLHCLYNWLVDENIIAISDGDHFSGILPGIISTVAVTRMLTGNDNIRL